jgi:hypothetical protein
VTEINTTRMLRRIEKYLAAGNRGGRRQTGETALGIAATDEPTFVRRLRRGAAIRMPLLSKMDEFLTREGY